MLDTIQSTTTASFIHGSDKRLFDQMVEFCGTIPDLAFRRTKNAFRKAHQTDHIAVEKQMWGDIRGVSLPFPQLQEYGPFQTSVGAVEILFHHVDEKECPGFLSRIVLPRQVELLSQKYPDLPIYTVVRESSPCVGVLRDHGWDEFELTFELIKGRERTGARFRVNDLWFRHSG